jgi:hypothetical protein
MDKARGAHLGVEPRLGAYTGTVEVDVASGRP